MRARAPLFLLTTGLILTYGDILLRFCFRLWGEDHYQFFPLYLAGVAALVVDRLRQERNQEQQEIRIGLISLGLFLISLIGAIASRSPLLGVCSLFFLGYSLLSEFPLARGAWAFAKE